MVLAFGVAGLLGVPQPATARGTTATAPTQDAAGKRLMGPTEPELSYVVNTTKTDAKTMSAVKKAIAASGGSVVASHSRIGVLIVRSPNAGFSSALRNAEGVQSVGATRTAPLASHGSDVGKPVKVRAPRRSASKPGKREPLESLQWDIAAIRADKASKVTQGSRKVTVAVIDSGVDDTHPDLAPNFSVKQSANCVGGKADNSKGAWRPNTKDDYHGTHVAGTIAAARNGVGVAGVAPGVRISSIKVSEPSGLYYAEAVICAFMFAAEHDVQVTNNSYYIDPWMFHCKENSDQAAVVEAVNRAAKFAENKGIVHVAAAGNSNYDLAAKSITDASSPNDSSPVSRDVNPSICWDIPAQLPGVVTVAATGPERLKSAYSNYGLHQIDVAAPGGDVAQVPKAPAKDGRILSTMPDGDYAYLQGTSMASPHTAGVAALIKSKHPKASPQEIMWRLKAQADNPGCPSKPSPREGSDQADAPCTGSKHVNSFYGFGIVDALDAVNK